MFGMNRTEKKRENITFKKFVTNCGVIFAFTVLAFAIEKIGGSGSGTFFDVARAIALVLYCVAYIMAGRNAAVSALGALFKGKIEIESLIVTVATLICILIGQYLGAVIAMFVFYIADCVVYLEKKEENDQENL